MPDHVHLVLRGLSGRSDLRGLMYAWKKQTGYAHRRTAGEPLWQAGYYDHVIRPEDDLFESSSDPTSVRRGV